MINSVIEGQDSDELEALFESIASARRRVRNLEPQSPSHGNQHPDYDKVISKIGHMTRTLHDALRELSHDKNLESSASSIPGAGDRLNYVTTMLEKSTERVLNATDAAQPVIEKIEVESQRLAREWQRFFDRSINVEQLRSLALQTRAFLADVPRQTKATNAYLMEIMMAQDLHNFTGQTVKKIVAVMQQTEKQLLELLAENKPSTANPDAYHGTQNGPVAYTAGRDEAGELLGSLGF